jgi:hypothetical protein
MHHRRPNAIAAPVLGLLLAASLSACGFHYPTDKINTISAGENNRTTSLDALGIRVLASGPGQGRLIGALSNELDTAATVTQVAGSGGDVTVAPFTPITLRGRAGYSLSAHAENPINISGTFQPGQVLMGVQLTFTRAGQPDTITLNVPVVKPCNQYTAVPTPSPSPATNGLGGKASATPTAAATGATNAFDCSDPSPSAAAGE